MTVVSDVLIDLPAGQLNEPFLRQVMRHIESHLFEWDQFRWANEMPDVTTYCFATWAYVLGTGERPFSVAGLTVGNTQPIPATAQRLLGFTRRQASLVFFYISKPNPRDRTQLVPVTFRDLCRQVHHATGVRYRPGQAPDAPA